MPRHEMAEIRAALDGLEACRIPKPLVAMGNKPIVEWIIEEFAMRGSQIQSDCQSQEQDDRIMYRPGGN